MIARLLSRPKLDPLGLADAVGARFGRKLFADNARNAWNRLMETV
jgi:hypothetical protein